MRLTYSKIINTLESLKVDYLNPIETNEQIKQLDVSSLKKTTNTTKEDKNLLYYLIVLNSIFPWLIWNKAKKKIKEDEFKSTFRFGLGISLFPIFYLIQAIIISFIFSKTIGVAYFSFSIISGLILTKFSKSL